MTLLNHRAGLILITLTMLACDESESNDPTVSPEVGDWFACSDEACSELNDDGFRLSADGTWYQLEADGSRLEPGEAYCKNAWPGAAETYTYMDSMLLIDGTGGWLGCASTGCSLLIDGDTAQIVLEDQRTFALRRVSDGSTETCP